MRNAHFCCDIPQSDTFGMHPCQNSVALDCFQAVSEAHSPRRAPRLEHIQAIILIVTATVLVYRTA